MKCVLCEIHGPGVVMENGNGICFSCIRYIKKFEVLAPFPLEEAK